MWAAHRKDKRAERSPGGIASRHSWMLNAPNLGHLHSLSSPKQLPYLWPSDASSMWEQTLDVLLVRCKKQNTRSFSTRVCVLRGGFVFSWFRASLKWRTSPRCLPWVPPAAESRVTALENVPPPLDSADLFMWSSRPAGNVYSCSVWSKPGCPRVWKSE